MLIIICDGIWVKWSVLISVRICTFPKDGCNPQTCGENMGVACGSVGCVVVKFVNMVHFGYICTTEVIYST